MSTGPRGGHQRQAWTRRKRSSGAARAYEEADVRRFFEDALTLNAGSSAFDMDLQTERDALADMLWRRAEILGPSSMSATNRELAAVLEVLVHNTYRPMDMEKYARRTQFRVESILVDLQRAQSQKRMPLLTARISCACMRAQLKRALWMLMSHCFPGLLASLRWTEEFVEYASSRRPPCEYEELPLVSGVVFDNYQRKVLYSSKVTAQSHGFLLDMTNWGTFRIPRMLVPQDFDANQLCESIALPCKAC